MAEESREYPGKRREIALILEYLRRERNLDFSGYHSPMIERRIFFRLEASPAQDLTGYLLLLEKDRGEIDALLGALAISVSEFFRDPLVFALIESRVIPLLVHALSGKAGRSLRVWSAGCASGEEAYSMAILLSEACSHAGGETDVSIFGTDIDRKGLALAAAGVYAPERVRNVRTEHLLKHFVPAGDRFGVVSHIRSMVGFSEHDLLSEREEIPSESVYGGFDIILCRNVLIYLDREHQARLLGRLDRALRPGGFLVLGEAESLDDLRFMHFRQICGCCKVFRKSFAH